ncbi:DUF1467 family protein [Roseibacterium beibuensis]|uniref:Secreted protein n=1 Tax=[Roseibacterium] beibuensis TaxID=1193142 RepID=A0ABP9L8B7_9RHOB|nr:DUF1467 family protein [Roseibacterium beibuensis]MCS6623829.1 DUF1467 family protein [Roseibacterium beibuensis]
MNVVTGIVLYAIIWFMTLLIVLQTGVTSQDEAGERVRGTHGSAPENPQLKKRFLITTVAAFAVWAVVAAIILTDFVTIEDFDLFTRFGLGSTN